jgi:hypothetical protein
MTAVGVPGGWHKGRRIAAGASADAAARPLASWFGLNFLDIAGFPFHLWREMG